MLDLGWQELFFIALLALIVVGPKDLPIMVRSISRWIFKARRLVQDFQGSMETAARELEIDTIKHEVNKVYDDTEDGFLTQNDKMTEGNHQEVESSNKKDPQEGGGQTAGSFECYTKMLRSAAIAKCIPDNVVLTKFKPGNYSPPSPPSASCP